MCQSIYFHLVFSFIFLFFLYDLCLLFVVGLGHGFARCITVSPQRVQVHGGLHALQNVVNLCLQLSCVMCILVQPHSMKSIQYGLMKVYTQIESYISYNSKSEQFGMMMGSICACTHTNKHMKTHIFTHKKSLVQVWYVSVFV